MKLFMVYYLFGTIIGSAGPLPYDMDHCVIRAQEMLNNANATTSRLIAEGKQLSDNGRLIGLNDVQFKCEYLTSHPFIKDPITIKP